MRWLERLTFRGFQAEPQDAKARAEGSRAFVPQFGHRTAVAAEADFERRELLFGTSLA